jgi:hypothetical protein
VIRDALAGEQVQKGFALAWGPVQYDEGLYEDPEVQEYNNSVARNRPPSESYAELSGALQEELNAAVTGTRPVEDALERMNERAVLVHLRLNRGGGDP